MSVDFTISGPSNQNAAPGSAATFSVVASGGSAYTYQWYYKPGVKPAYSLDFTGGTLPSGITFTRASVGTYFNSSGLMLTAANNVPRFNYIPSAGATGLLIEQSSTNLCTHSQDFNLWSKANGGAGLSPVVTLNNVVAPDGTTTGDSIAFSANGTSSYSLLIGNSTSVSGPSTFSIYAQSTTGSAQQFVAYQTSPYILSATTPATGWQQFQMAEGSGSVFGRFGCNTNVDPTILTSNTAFWGAQIENTPYATSYIPTTTAAASRSADDAIMADISGWYLPAGGTVIVEFIPNQILQGFIFSLNDGTVGNIIESTVAATQVTNGGASEFTGTLPTLNVGVINKVGLVFGNGNFAASANGSTPVTAASGTIPTVTRLELGAQLSTNHLNGTIVKVDYYAQQLSVAQLQALTT